MISKRIIPYFLLSGSRLVKGARFSDFVDVGNPVSQGMIYDAQGADELIMVDIDASKEGRIIDVDVIQQMIKFCRLPIAAGGGIKTLEDARKCFMAGADKVVINTHAVKNPELITELVSEFGSQSIVVSLDVRKEKTKEGDYNLYINSGRKKANLSFIEMIKKIDEYGAGELIITSIENEGSLTGFDIDIYVTARKFINVPLIASGGASSYDDIVKLFDKTDSDACAIGKMLFLRDYDIVRIKSYLKGKKIFVREA